MLPLSVLGNNNPVCPDDQQMNKLCNLDTAFHSVLCLLSLLQ